MNRNRFRLIRNRLTQIWVPVPEFARGRGKLAARAVLMAAVLSPSVAAAAGALPTACAPGTCGPGVPGFVSHGSAAYSATGSRGTVSQVGNKAILNWQNFNVGRGNTVTFQQVQSLAGGRLVGGASFSTLNRIWDADPSVIAGAINVASGQQGNLTFINRNGIVFSGTAQIDVNSLTAGSLDMKDQFFTGVLTPFGNSEAQFEGSGGFVSVLEGARISAANGGRVMLLAPSVTNHGRIEAQDGQAILAAGSKVYLSASQDANLRGILVEVDSPSGLAAFNVPNAAVPASVTLDGQTHAVADVHSQLGHASNTGTVQVGTGNATMVGYAVNQMGRVSATNSVVFNGSVYLTAKDGKKDLRDSSGVNVIGFASTRAGQLRVGENSSTAIMPALDSGKVQAALAAGTLTRESLDAYLAGEAPPLDFVKYMSTTTSLDAQTFNKGQLRIVGEDVKVGSGAQLRAPAGEITAHAIEDPSRLRIYDPNAADPFDTPNSGSSVRARLQIDAGARIDVSGLEAVPVSVARNVVEARLQGDELKDSPVNRDGDIRGEKVWIDVTRGSALVANVGDYQAQISRGIAERSTEAGTISLRSLGDVNVAGGAVLDVSGGHVDYTAAATKRTLLAANGKLVDIADARPELRYDGVASRIDIIDARWGNTRSFGVGEDFFNPGYREGKDAGTVEVLSRRIVFDGSVSGRTRVGEFQAADFPAGAALRIGASLGSGSTRDHFLAQGVVVGAGLAGAAGDSLVLPAGLFGGDGVNRLEIYSNDSIKVGQPLQVAPGGSVRLTGEGVAADAGIKAPGGSIVLSARDNFTSLPSDAIDVRVAGGVELDVAGRWINDAPAAVSSLDPRVIHGGNITLAATEDLVLGDGTRLNLAGGAFRNASGRLSTGNGGSLALDFLQLRAELPDDKIALEKHIDAAGTGKGGALTLSAERIEIGEGPVGAGRLLLDPRFFRQGFGSYSVTGIAGLDLLPGAQLLVRTASRELSPSALTALSGTDIRSITGVVERADELRPAADLALKTGEFFGPSKLELGSGSAIGVDPGAGVSLTATGRMNLLGTVSAPAGSITATLGKDINSNPYDANDAIVLGAGARLSVAGVSRVFAGVDGLRNGDVLNGGSIALNAFTGYLLADRNAMLDVSGAAAVAIDRPNAQGGFGMMVASDAGRVSVSAREGLVFEAAVLAQGGGPQSRGGSFELAFGSKATSSIAGGGGYPTASRVLALGGPGPGLPSDLNTLSGRAWIDPQQLEQSGVDALSMTSLDTIRFQSDMALGSSKPISPAAVRLDAPQIDINGHAVAVRASSVELGNYDPDRQSNAAAASAGTGSFAAEAGFLELAGNARWDGAANLQFSSSGELRASGVRVAGAGRPSGKLDTAAAVTLSAGVVAPSTLSDFVLRTTGDLDIAGAGAMLAPLSAQGRIAFEAANIVQGGRVHAPLGEVSFAAADSLTLLDGSVTSAAGVPGITPFGMTVNGRAWIYDFGSGTQTVDKLAEKTVRLKGQSVDMRAGARVDISGGGDLQAWEFTPGPGGSTDVLAAAGVYAILPGYRGTTIPGDPQNAAGFDLATGTAVWLDNAQGLAAGVYTLLPAHYALLPGAYMVRLADAARDVLPGQGGARMDGSLLVSGYLTDARHAAGGPRDGRYSGFTLLSQAEVLKRSEFTLTGASSFFSTAASGQSGAAGNLVIDAAQALTLNSVVESAGLAGFRGAQVDISAPKIAVVGAGGAAVEGTGFLEIQAQSLNGLNAASLLLGGTRSTTAEGVEVRVGAQEVVVANTAEAALTGPELLFAATDKVTVKAGAVVEGKGTAAPGAIPKLITGFRIADSNGSGTITAADDNRGDVNGDGQITALDSISGNGALLRVAAANRSVTLERRNVDRSAGEIVIEGAQASGDGGRPAALLRADGAMRIDATRDTVVNGELQLATGGALALGASRVSVGETAGVTEGLILSNERIAALGKPADFSIRSYSSFDLYGSAVLGDPLAGAERITNLTVEAGGIGGHSNTGKTAVIAADTVTLANPDGTVFSGAVSPGDGNLRIAAQTVRLGSGGNESAPFEVHGFSAATISASREIVAQGSSSLKSDMPLTLETGRITGTGGADATIQVNGRLTTSTHAGSGGDSADAGLGGKLTLIADTIVHGTRIELPSGLVTLQATGAAGTDAAGSITLGPDAAISVAGRNVDFFDVSRPVTGGRVTLSSLNADVRVHAAATVDVSGADGADAGKLTVQANQGSALLEGRLLGAAHSAQGNTPRQGSFELDVATISNFNQLNQLLESEVEAGRVVSGGFNESRVMRIRNGDVMIGSASDPATTVTAHRFELAADSGHVDVHGRINADGDRGGKIRLFAGSGIDVHPGAVISAKAGTSGGSGGEVLLSAAAGSVAAAAGAMIDVSSGSDGRGGVVHLRAPRSAGNDGINISSLQAEITGAAVIRAEGFKAYDNITGIAPADFSDGGAWYSEARDFMSNAGSIRAGLGVTGDDRFQLVPGIELRSTGGSGGVVDQALSGDWSLHAWRYDPDTGAVAAAGALADGLNAAGKPLVAGVLTLRSTGALNLDGSLSDGFGSAATSAPVQGRESWSYRLVAGADLSAANPLQVTAGASDIRLANAKLVRSGTGNIEMAAADGIRMGNVQSVVYTAGRPVDAADLAGFNIMPVDPLGTGVTAADYRFTQDGGDIRMSAGGDIELLNTPLSNARQLYSNWLYRQGQVDDEGRFSTTFAAGARVFPQTAWWVRFEQFQQGVAALGGGDVTAAAGGSIRNVSMSSATQGYMTSPQPDAASLKVLGGGDLRVTAGGDLQGGQYWSGRGRVDIDVDGSLGATSIPTTNAGTLRRLYPIVALGDSQADVRARGNVELHGVIDPLLVVQERGAGRNYTSTSQSNAGFSRWSLFTSQDEDTAAALASLNGSVRIHNPDSTDNSTGSAVGVQQAFSSLAQTPNNNNWSWNLYNAFSDRPLSLAPASLQVTAYQGDVEILNNLVQPPSAQGSLMLLSGGNVSIPGTLVMSDMDRGRLPQPSGSPGLDASDLPSAIANWRSHAELAPVHPGGADPVLVHAATGAITGKANTTSLILAKSARLRAATDIVDIGLEAQNLGDGDVTAVQAGNDIRFTNAGSRAPNSKIRVGGPGLVDVEAGRNLDLGASDGIVTRGDLDNPVLPANGASIHVAVGVANGVDYQGAMNRLVTALQSAAGAGVLLDDATLWQVRWLTGDNGIVNAASALAAVQAVAALPDAEQRLRLRSMFFQALRDTGRDFNNAASPYAGSYDRGYRTIELLFPGIDERSAGGRSLHYDGELNLFASRIRSESGGDIEFLVPGGQAVIGLAQLAEALSFEGSGAARKPAALGMVTVEQGSIRGFTREDVLVNQSRILTVGGGDIVLWSSEADIDAGKGKRTVTSVPPPVIRFDSSGNVTVELQGVATGSGIGALAGQPGITAGDVDLIAPKGAVNAGEAGIRATNLNIAARIVLNAENIQVSGATTGAPVADTSTLSAGLAGNSVSNMQGEDAARSLGNQSAAAQKTADEVRRALAAFNLISVEVLGLGEQ